MTSLLSIIVPLTLTAGAQKSSAPSEVSRLLATKLPALGHRNWVVVVDAAYPLQTSAGIETITVQQNQISIHECVHMGSIVIQHCGLSTNLEGQQKRGGLCWRHHTEF